MAAGTALAFWAVYFALVSARGLAAGFPDQWELSERRVMATLVGLLLTGLLYLALRPVAKAGIGAKALFGAALCIPAALLFAAFNYFVFYVYAPLTAPWMQGEAAEMLTRVKPLFIVIDTGISWYFFFAAWAALYLAMSYAAQLRAADHRAARLAREAQDAQLRALRYQINPHFLFNTLNALSSLVLSNRTDVAERMLMNLSAFFRTTLAADPTADVSLDEEIRLQRLYLDIEQIRFPERLRIEVAVPPDVGALRVPVLLLQPLVENAVKYGVARSKRAVTIRIAAFLEAGRLHIKVSDDGDGPDDPFSPSEGTGVGLRNVSERLEARFGPRAAFFAGAEPDGGFTAHIVLPVLHAD